jgi:uncharacterized protein YgiM (DUF1202 family)
MSLDPTPLEKHLVGFAVRPVIVCILLALLTSCSPFDGSESPTDTASPARPVIPPVSSQVPTPSPTCTVRTGIPAGSLNLRTGAGTQYSVIRILTEGEILIVLERAAWLKVTDEGGQQGFVNARYCK